MNDYNPLTHPEQHDLLRKAPDRSRLLDHSCNGLGCDDDETDKVSSDYDRCGYCRYRLTRLDMENINSAFQTFNINKIIETMEYYNFIHFIPRWVMIGLTHALKYYDLNMTERDHIININRQLDTYMESDMAKEIVFATTIQFFSDQLHSPHR